MKTLLALDPGKTTGASVWNYDTETPLQLVTHFQIDGGVDGFLDWFYPQGKAQPFDVVISENFKLDGRTPNPNLTPLLIEGVLMSYAQTQQKLVRFQRNNFKKHISDKLLKELGFYFKGQPHATDSARHALAYMKTSKHMPTLKAYFADKLD
jgi:hypothetical protein